MSFENSRSGVLRKSIFQHVRKPGYVKKNRLAKTNMEPENDGFQILALKTY